MIHPNLFNTKNLPILFLFGFIVFIGFWSLNSLIFIFPILFIFLLKRKNLSFKISLLDIGITGVFITNIISFLFSEFPQNSLGHLTMISVILILHLVYKELFQNNKAILLNIINLFSLIIAIITMGFFWYFHSDLNSEGFYALNNFKNSYTPFGFLNNNWVSIFILFIPFQLILFLYQKNFRFLTYLNIGFTLFCVIVSFSRGAYLGILAFIIVFNLFAIKLIDKKRLILYNFILLAAVAVISLPVRKDFLTTFSYNKLNSQKRSSIGRISTWKHFVNHNKKPISGWGQGNLSIAIQSNPIQQEDINFSSRVNNSLLKMYIENGILGIISHLILIIIVLFIAIKNLNKKDLSKNKKLEIIIIISGLFAFVIRDLTFSSFTNNYVTFLFFHLIFLLIPYDYGLKEIKLKKTGKNVFLIFFLIYFLFLLFYNTKLLIAKNYNNQFISKYQKNELLQGLEPLKKAIDLSSNNVILLKHQIASSSVNAFGIEISICNKNLLQFKNVKKDTINTLINLSKALLNLNNYDDEVINNLGWLYFALNKKDRANIYFKKAILSSPHNSYYQMSKLLLNLHSSNLDSVQFHLTQALRYSPDIQESIFFREFSINYPNISLHAKNNAISDLKNILKNNKSPILQARLANLLIENNPTQALYLYKKITEVLPNMNRPWMYRAILSKKLNQDTSSIEIYFKHAVYLDSRDYLSKLKLAKFYKDQGADKKSILNYKEALINFNNINSLSYAKNRTISTFKTIRNASIPIKLTKYLKPDINALEVFKVIQKYYQNKGEIKGQNYYTELIKKYNNETYMGFEKIH